MLRIVYVISPERPTGIDLWRALGPGLAIKRHELAHVALVPMGGNPAAIEDADVLVLPTWAAKAFGGGGRIRANCEARHKLLVVDCCDDPFPDPDSPLEGRWADHPGGPIGERALDLIGAAHLVTVNTPAMQARLRSHFGASLPVQVVPDRIDADRWAGITPHGDGRVVVGVCGGDRHGRDWAILADAWRAVAAVHPEVTFKVVGDEQGGLADALPAYRYDRWDFLPIDRYQLGYGGIDVACAPLADTVFNRSKSPNKWLEHTLAGSAFVGSSVCYNRTVINGHTGLLADTTAEWRDAILRLLASPMLRRKLVANARRRVLDGWQLDSAHCRNVVRMYERHWRNLYARSPAAVPALN